MVVTVILKKRDSFQVSDNPFISHHSPPEGISIAVEICFPARPYCIFLTEIHEVAGEDQAKEANVESSDQLLNSLNIKTE